MFFCLFCAAKIKIIWEETKKSPKTLHFVKSSGREIMGLMKDYSVTVASGVTSLPVSLFQLLTSVSSLTASPPTGKVNL